MKFDTYAVGIIVLNDKEIRLTSFQINRHNSNGLKKIMYQLDRKNLMIVDVVIYIETIFSYSSLFGVKIKATDRSFNLSYQVINETKLINNLKNLNSNNWTAQYFYNIKLP